jgi:hypothetical protein
VSLEEFDAQGGLEPAHMVAHGAGGEAELFGGIGKVLVTRGYGKDAERWQGGWAKSHGSLRASNER